MGGPIRTFEEPAARAGGVWAVLALVASAVVVLAFASSAIASDEAPVAVAPPKFSPRAGTHMATSLPPKETKLEDMHAQRCTAAELCANRFGYGTVCADGHCTPYMDRTGLFALVGFSDQHADPEAYKLYPVIIPAIGFTPALGFLFGGAGAMGMYLGSPNDTTISEATALALYTTESQLLITLTTTGMTSGNEWELQGDWRFLLYNQNTFGLGTGTPPIDYGFHIGGIGHTAAIEGAQPMDFNLFRLHQVVLKKVFPYFYVGGAYRLDYYFSVVDLDLNLAARPPVVPSHYAYSAVFGFDQDHSTTSGVSAEVLYDSRDSTTSSYRGTYLSGSYGVYPKQLGSEQLSTAAMIDLRYFLGLSDAVPRNVVAFWILARGVVTGRQPYLNLPATAWDARGTTGRGYVQGRFRGPAEVYGEVEWRFRITNNGLLGGVVFINAETFSRPSMHVPGVFDAEGESLFNSIKPAGGVGLRLLTDPASRINLRLDIGFGVDSFGFYMGAGEAF